MQITEWAAAEATIQENAALAAGLTSERDYHFGRAVVLYMVGDKANSAKPALMRGLSERGGKGTRFVAGMRDAERMIEGARSMLDAQTKEAAGEWAADSSRVG